MDDNLERPVPGWFMGACVVVLLFELFGCYSFGMDMTASLAGMEPDQRLMWQAAPGWMMVAYAVAVGTGLIGALMLLLRRRVAVPILLVSFVAAMVQFSALLIVPGMRNLIGSDDLFVPFMIILACYGAWHFARTAAKRGWLR